MELPFRLPRNRWEHCFESQSFSFSFSLAMHESNTFETTKIGAGSSTPGLYYVPVICQIFESLLSCNTHLNQRKSIRRFLFTLQCVSATSVPLMELGINFVFKTSSLAMNRKAMFHVALSPEPQQPLCPWV